MILDIDNTIKDTVLGSFAADTKLWQVAHKHVEIQSDLMQVSTWVDDNNMMVNCDKYLRLPVGHKAGSEPAPYHANNNDVITDQEHVKDLGIYISSDFTFDYHITNMVGRGEAVASWILRTFTTRDQYPISILLKTLLVPTLEYGCVLWNPNSGHLRELIENVQKRFTSRISIFNEINEETGLLQCTTNYWERLKILKIYSLERRRERYIILFMYKIITKLYPNPGFDLSSIVFNERGEVRMDPKFDPRAPSWVKRLRTASIFSKGPRLLETVLPYLGGMACLTNPAPNVVDFKEKLDKVLVTIPDEPTVPGLTANMRPALSNSILDQIRHGNPTPV